MNPVIPCSVGSVPLIPRPYFFTRKNNPLIIPGLSGNSVKHGSSTLRFRLPPLVTNGLLLQNKRKYPFHKKYRTFTSATETEVAVDNSDSHVADGDSAETSETLSDEPKIIEDSKSDASPASAKASRSRTARRSDMPPVKNEDLIPGATFTGKVKSIQPYGAFIDFGAFTDGLVHVSRLSDGYVKDVASVVSVGQEVKVKLIEVNSETQRISLSMREGDDTGKLKQLKDTPISAEKAGPGRMNTSKSSPRKDFVKKNTKFVTGQDLEGTVKNMTRTGSFISLPHGEEGFLPISEESEEGFGNVTGVSSLQVSQEVSVRVLRIARGQVTLTMKKDEDIAKLDSEIGQGIVHATTNPFALAFRQNRDIAAFLDEREKIQNSVKAPSTIASEKLNGVIKQGETLSDVSDVQGELESSESLIEVPCEVKNNAEDDISEIDVNVAVGENAVDDASTAVLDDEKDPVSNISSPVLDVDGASEKEVKMNSGSLAPEGDVPTVDKIVEDVTQTNVTTSNVKSESPLAVTNNPEEEFSAATPNDSDEIQPNPNSISSITASDITSSAPASQETAAAILPALVKQLREETGAGIMDCKMALSETDGDIIKALDFLRKKGLASAEKKASRVTAEGRIGSYIHDSRIGILVEVNCETDFVSRGEIFKELVDDIAMQVAACPHVQYLVPEDVPEEIVNKEKGIEMQKEDLLSKPEQMRSKIVEGRIRKRLEELALLEQPYIKNDKVAVKDWVKQTISTVGENIKVKRFVRFNLGEGLEKKSQDFAAEVAAQTEAKPVPTPEKEQAAVAEDKETEQKPPAVTVSAALVKQLREETGAGMMDCKKALAETGGDLEKAQFYLRKKGLSTADKKSSRLAAEGRIGSYIHNSRIGVLIEVNCETDFVGRSEKFKDLVDDLAMQVVACPQVRFVSIEDIPESIVNKEKEIEMQREDIVSKPENMRERIVEGRVSKRLGELALLEQPFVKDNNVLVKDLVKQTVAAIGENIKVRRFVRFTLGETTESETTKAAQDEP